jgi:hypothetical protein
MRLCFQFFVTVKEKTMSIPSRLDKLSQYIETRSKAKSFTFEVIYGGILEMA